MGFKNWGHVDIIETNPQDFQIEFNGKLLLPKMTLLWVFGNTMTWKAKLTKEKEKKLNRIKSVFRVIWSYTRNYTGNW